MILQLDVFFKLQSSLIRFFLYLFGFSLLAFIDIFAFSKPTEQIHMIWSLVLTVVAAFSMLYVLRVALRRTELNPFNMFTTAMIVYLLLHTTISLWMFPLAIICAGFSKLLRYKSQPVFNPAAIGLFVTFYLTTALAGAGLIQEAALISWWGADMIQSFLADIPLINYALAIAILLTFVYYANSYKKLPYVGSFVMTVFLVLFFDELTARNSSADAFLYIARAPFTSFSFLALVMLAEPKTSPVFVKQQVVAGILVGLFFFAGALKGLPIIGSEISFILTVLFGNMVNLAFKSGTFLR